VAGGTGVPAAPGGRLRGGGGAAAAGARGRRPDPGGGRPNAGGGRPGSSGGRPGSGRGGCRSHRSRRSRRSARAPTPRPAADDGGGRVRELELVRPRRRSVPAGRISPVTRARCRSVGGSRPSASRWSWPAR